MVGRTVGLTVSLGVVVGVGTALLGPIGERTDGENEGNLLVLGMDDVDVTAGFNVRPKEADGVNEGLTV